MLDSFKTLSSLENSDGQLFYYSLSKLQQQTRISIEKFPWSIKILIEAVLHNENGLSITQDHINRLLRYSPSGKNEIELPFTPARVLLQDFTGVPCIVDLAAMRNAIARLGGDPKKINPALPVDLIIDHSIQVDHFNSPDAARQNTEMEFIRNRERYEFLRWGQKALRNFSVVPPASGICHQVNLEYLGKVVQTREENGKKIAYFDSLVGTDSHTPMINGLGVLGWGVGGIEAEAAMLGQPIIMLAPSVVGFRLTGAMRPGITATDLVLTITQMLRRYGVVGKFVEFFGTGLSAMSVPDRATISNMAPEYGATVGYFPVDEQTLSYMYSTGRPRQLLDLVRSYMVAQGLFRDDSTPDPQFESVLELDLGSVVSSIAGPKRPQDRIALSAVKSEWHRLLRDPIEKGGFAISSDHIDDRVTVRYNNADHKIGHGDVVIAAITSCTNTSNPSVLLGAGLLAKKACEAGLKSKPWIKTSFAPGSVVVVEYLKRLGLMKYLEQLGFHLVGYGCTTCIGNSGPLPQPIAEAIDKAGIIAGAVLSGNRNFEGRVNPHTRANFLASPPLVVAYALAGTMEIGITTEPIGEGANGNPIYLKDIWPDQNELDRYVEKAFDREAFQESYRDIESSNNEWNTINFSDSEIYQWDENSSYIQEPPFFIDMAAEATSIASIVGGRVLVMAGDSVTTDHISPAGAIDPDSPAGQYLQQHKIERSKFNSYGSRRGNDRIMVRGTFANIRFRNKLAEGHEGSFTLHHPSGKIMSIYDAAQRYRNDKTPTIVIAGKDYGMGSSRDWAAKGPYLLGIRAVIAESFERIHRSNLVGMGILPLQFQDGQNAASLGLDGSEQYTIQLGDSLHSGQSVVVTVIAEGRECSFSTRCRIDSPVEVEYYRHGGILQYVLRRLLN